MVDGLRQASARYRSVDTRGHGGPVAQSAIRNLSRHGADPLATVDGANLLPLVRAGIVFVDGAQP